MPEIFRNAGLGFSYAESGSGPTVLFQHGLGGDKAQVAEVFPESVAHRLTLECRAHGGSGAGPHADFSIATFAADALALATARGTAPFVAGGISMGAAIALRLGVTQPVLVRALILVRPAWLFAAAPDNMRPFGEVAALLNEYPPDEAKTRFASGATAQHLATAAPDNLTSLLGFFARPQPHTTAALLGRIAADGPGVTESQAAALQIPALVIGCEIDSVHPLAYAERLSAVLPRATLVRVTPKAQNRTAHAAELRAAIGGFLATLDRNTP